MAEDAKQLLAEADRLAWLGNSDKAGPLYAKAEELSSSAGDARNALYAKVGRLHAQMQANSLPELSAELKNLIESPVVQSDLQLKLKVLVAKGDIDLEFNPSSSRQAWEEVLQTAQAMGENAWEARAQGEMGYITFFQGDMSRTEDLLRESVESAEASGDIGAQIWYATIIAGALIDLGLYDQAIKYCDEALNLAESNKDVGVPFVAYAVKARALVEFNQTQKARKILSWGLKQVKSLGRHMDETYFLIALAGLAVKEKNFALAVSYLESAGNVCVRGGFQHSLAWSMFELARVYVATGEFQKAEDRAGRALQAMRQVQDLYHLPLHLTLLAQLKANQGKLAEADSLYDRATDLTEAMLVNIPSALTKTSLIASMSSTYLGHFSLAVDGLKDNDKAFKILERARGRTTADFLRSRPLRVTELPAMRREREKEITEIQIALGDTTKTSERKVLLEKLWHAQEMLNSVPLPKDFFQEQFIRNSPVTLQKIRDQLMGNELLLEYVLSEPSSYCFVIAKDGVRVIGLAGRTRIEAQVESYLEDIKAKKSSPEKARRLYSTLLEPIAEAKKKGRLIIVPDGKLHLLPFEALQDSKGHYQLESNIITTVPSATVLSLLRGSPPKTNSEVHFLGVGDVPYGEQALVKTASVSRNRSPDITRGQVEADLGHLRPLRQSRDEVITAAEILGTRGTFLLGEEANEATFKSQPLGRFDILHFAVHAIADTTYPDRAALVLARDPSSQEDGLLQEREITFLPLNAKLVVLSACDTGVGRLREQEGISNLARSFLFAGARSVVASLWPAADNTTSILMTQFYTGLAAGNDEATALQQAKISVLKRVGPNASPYYWACFTLIGEGSRSISTPIRTSSTSGMK